MPLDKTLLDHWISKILVVTLPALFASYFTYRTSKAEIAARAAQNTGEAAAGYGTLVKAVEDLQEGGRQCELDIAGLKGQVQVLSGQVNRLGVQVGRSAMVRESGGGAAVEVHLAAAPAPRAFKPLPRKFDDAVKAFKKE